MPTLRAAAALATLTACAPAPRPEPLHNVATAPAAARDAAGPQCPPPPPSRVRPSRPSLGAIAGMVIDEHCEVIAGATVLALGDRGAASRVDLTDEHGRFAFDDLSPDQYLISVYYLDAKLERGGVLIRAGAVEQVQLAMPPPIKAEPRITQDPTRP